MIATVIPAQNGQFTRKPARKLHAKSRPETDSLRQLAVLGAFSQYRVRFIDFGAGQQ